MKSLNLYKTFNLRTTFIVLAMFVIAGIGTFTVPSCSRSTGLNIIPEVLNLGKFKVTIAWISEKAYSGRIFYRPAGSDATPISVSEAFGDSYQHEIVITGLNPSTRYTYWFEGSDNRYQFQTQPSPNTPFSFLVISGDVSDRINELVLSEAPEFLVFLGVIAKGDHDPFSSVRPYLPVYDHTGVQSPFLAAVRKEKTDSPKPWKIDWGGLRLIFLSDAETRHELFDNTLFHTFGIITDARAIETLDKAGIQRTALHSDLTDHNKNKPGQPAAFVSVIGKKSDTAKIGDIQYFGIPVRSAEDDNLQKDSCVIRIDVDVESITAYFVDENREIALKVPPIAEKRTCEECRRLADKGAYEESLKAYLVFIKNNKGHFQIEDAYFAVAEILDGKLFNFERGLTWYRRLIDEYPNGTLTPLAKQRVGYLTKYSDYDFKPLTRFERIKKVEFARKKNQAEERNKLLEEVSSIIYEYPDSSLAPVMQYWLAKQLAQTNTEKAVDAYLKLKEKYPGHPDAKEAFLEIGEIYYNARQYNQSIETYEKALSELPDLEKTIRAQINRCKRNMRRDTIALICYGILSVMTILVIVIRPFCRRHVLSAFAACLILLPVLSLGAWLIHEQFSSIKELFWIVVSFSVIPSAGAFVSRSLTEKLFFTGIINVERGRYVLPGIFGNIAGMMFLSAGAYLALYHINVHYLIVVGL